MPVEFKHHIQRVSMVSLSKELTLARQLLKKGNLEAARQKFATIFRLAPNMTKASLEYASILERMRLWPDLLVVCETLYEKAPNDVEFNSQLFKLYIKLGRFEEAELKLNKLEQLNPGTYELAVQKYSYATSSGKTQDALHYAIEAVKLRPDSISAYINLGAAFCGLGMREQGRHAFETVLHLDPENVFAFSNLAYIAAEELRVDEALDLYQQTLTLNKNYRVLSDASIQFPLSFQYLHKGILDRGWECYDIGFDLALPSGSRRSPDRKFHKLKWSGENILNKKILVWREQGLGDELRFLGVLPDLIAIAKDVIIECDPRLVNIFRRSFPSSAVRPAQWDIKTGKSIEEDYDLQIPIGSLMRYLRKDITDFYPQRILLTPDENDREQIKSVFNNIFSTGLKIGICWRSGQLDPVRNSGYTNLADWAEILQMNGCHFVTLQYGDTESEIKAAEAALGITIHRWSDLDLKNDLDGVFALMSELDLVISVGTAVAEMAPLVGTETWQLFAGKPWTMLGQNKWPWAPNVQSFYPESGINMAHTMGAVTDALRKRVFQ